MTLTPTLASVLKGAEDRARSMSRTVVTADDVLISLVTLAPDSPGTRKLTRDYGITPGQIAAVIQELQTLSLSSAQPDSDAMHELVGRVTGHHRRVEPSATMYYSSDVDMLMCEAREAAKLFESNEMINKHGYPQYKAYLSKDVVADTDHLLYGMAQIQIKGRDHCSRAGAILGGFVDLGSFSHALVERTLSSPGKGVGA
jgi:hypothetical protein